MKKIPILFFALLMISISESFGQDCRAYFPMKEGVSFEMTSYNPKGKESSKALHTITSTAKTDNGTVANVSTKVTTDNKKQEPINFEYQVMCENGVFKMNRFGGMSSEQMGMMNGSVDVKGDYLGIPGDVKVGQTLPDAEIIMTVNLESGGPVMTFTYNITNRKVEAYEDVETPSGNYNAMKISYDVSTKMLMTMQSRASEWFVEGVGVVKSEQYNKNGKLQSYSLLSAIDGI